VHEHPTPLISQIFLVPFGLRNRVLLAGLLSLRQRSLSEALGRLVEGLGPPCR
jgi:predicted lipid carrier protein YhbT